MFSKKYDNNIDYEFLKSMGVEIEELMPWQFALSHSDVEGRFMWYPEGGSLIYELPEWGVNKVGVFTDSEEVYKQMMKKEK